MDGRAHERGLPRAALGCTICGAPLGLHERALGPVCASLACRTALAVRTREAERRAREADLEAASRWFRDGERAGEDVPSESVVVVPAQDRPVEARDPERVAAFVVSLLAAVEEALGGGPFELPAERSLAPDLATLLGEGCALCRGFCCERGATHAFLTGAEIAAKRGAALGFGKAEILAAYLAWLPERSVRGSCVYHGVDGCALPRALRASICNDYLCRGLVRLAEAAGDGTGPLHVAAVANGEVRRGKSCARPGAP